MKRLGVQEEARHGNRVEKASSIGAVAAVVGCLLRRDTSRSFPLSAPVTRRALSDRLVAAVNPSRRSAAGPPAAQPLDSSTVSPTLALDSGAASGGGGYAE